MPLTHPFLTGSNRIREAHDVKGRSIKPAPPHDEQDAVRRIQKALRAVGFPMTESFKKDPNGDGRYGQETFDAVIEFQRRVFKGDLKQHDGRVGPKTLDELDRLLSLGKPIVIDPPTIKPTTDILMFFTGFNDKFGGDELTSGSGVFQFNDLSSVGRPGVKKVVKGFVGSLINDFGPTKAFRFIDDEFNGGKLILYGFSAGAKQLTELCTRLESRNTFRQQEGRQLISVDLLVTIDAAARENNALVPRTVAGSVRVNLNLFQTTASPSGSHGAANTAQQSKLTEETTQVVNLNMDASLNHGLVSGITSKTEHEQMETVGHPFAMNAIRATLAKP